VSHGHNDDGDGGRKSILITDVDNTLLDWVEIWHASFSAMLEELIRLSGLPSELLVREIRTIHQREGTSEYAFIIEELHCLRHAAGKVPMLEFYEPAIRAYGNARAEALALYPGVAEFLQGLRERGVLIVAYTESLAFYTAYRFRKLGLDRIIDFLYSPPDHDLPGGRKAESLRRYPPEHYRMARTVHRHTPKNELKPNPDILCSIIAEVGGSISQAVYVGDSKMKDIAMAQQAGVLDVHAAYGVAQHREAYELLRAVTHWPDSHVMGERAATENGQIRPTIVLKERLADLDNHVSFGRFHGSGA
jgi:phosphoglycolate phosphatase-like HAD superfamily hydrolase